MLPVPTEPGTACVASLRAPRAALATSPDGALLTLTCPERVSVHAWADLEAGKTDPLATAAPPAGSAFAAAAATTAPPRLGALTTDGALLDGALTQGQVTLAPAPAPVATAASAAWGPRGARAVGARGALAVDAPGRAGAFAVALDSQDAADGDALTVDGVAWVGEGAVLASASVARARGGRAAAAPLFLVRWPSWDPASAAPPPGLTVTEFFGAAVDPGAPGGLAAASLGGAAFAAAAAAADDHARLLVLPPDPSAPPIYQDVADDWAALRLPNGPGDAPNFVVGAAAVATDCGGPVDDPNPESPSLPPQPTLVLATSDGVLRLVTLGRVGGRGEAVAPPTRAPVPPALAPGPAPAASAASSPLVGGAAPPPAPAPSDGGDSDAASSDGGDSDAA